MIARCSQCPDRTNQGACEPIGVPGRHNSVLKIEPTWFAGLVFSVVLSGCARPDLATFDSILDRQAAAWNRGDIDSFMADYWNSDDLTFSSGGQTRRGWETTRDRYKSHYPTPAEMGQLRFDNLEFQPLAADAALVLGNWHLDRASGPIGGNFSLVFRRLHGTWVIVHDHSSTKDK